MSLHISAKKGEIASVVLMPGDPLRAKFLAEHFLENYRLVSETRNNFYFTGQYKGKPVTVGASGMGCPSIGIYSYELYTEYEVQHIIRIGTCGAYTTELELYDLINVNFAVSESTYARHAWGIPGNTIRHQGEAYQVIKSVAKRLKKKIVHANVHSSDIFYRKTEEIPPLALRKKCLAVEMETFALFANARHLGKSAATLLTVSDILPSHQRISPEEREKSLLPMMELALETAVRL
ncbi:MAG: purine-nucleoside phosphorylase [Chitinophagaceae bacterium]|nr:purine-nucleoside phosphorylase [Chitinophagaceae bacterium]